MNGFSAQSYSNVVWKYPLCSITKWFHLYHLVIMGVPSALLQLSSLKNLSCLLRGFGEENLQTLNDVKNVSTNFYKLDFHTSNGDHAVLCLETSNLGSYYGINHKMCVKFSTHYGLSPDDILCVNSTPIDILLGLDAAALLLNKLFFLNGKKVNPLLWVPNVFLYGSPASNEFSLVGRMNTHYPVKNSRDKNKASGVFYFADEAKLVS